MLRRRVTPGSTGSPAPTTTMPSASTIATAAGAVRGSPTARPSAIAPGAEPQLRTSGALAPSPGCGLAAALRRQSRLLDAGSEGGHQVLHTGPHRRLDRGRACLFGTCPD